MPSGIDITLPLFKINSRVLAFDLYGVDAKDEIWQWIAVAGQKTGDRFRVRVDRPFRPRRTGPRSGSARLHGHCHDLAVQMAEGGQDVGELAARIKQAMKRMTAGEGLWRTFLDIDGTEQPISEAEASVEEETAINRVLQRFADEHGLWLTEYIDELDPSKGTFRSVGGRSYGAMLQYWKEEG